MSQASDAHWSSHAAELVCRERQESKTHAERTMQKNRSWGSVENGVEAFMSNFLIPVSMESIGLHFLSVHTS